VGENGKNPIVSRFQLDQNYPNPFNPTTTISFSLPNASIVTLQVFDPTGREITTILDNAKREAGNHAVAFDASDLPSGVYFFRIQTGQYAATKKMMLIK